MKIQLIIIRLLTILTFFASTYSLKAQWEQLKPAYGGYVSCILAEDNEIFVGTLYGGIYYSFDYGENWHSRYKDLHPCIKDIDKMDSILFATGVYGLYTSYNNGHNWEFNPLAGINITHDMTATGVKDSVLVMGNMYGQIIRSLDKGSNWDIVFWGIGQNSVIRFRIIEDKIFACLSGGEGGLLVSDDNGSTWNYQNSGLEEPGVSDIILVNDEYYISTTKNGIYRSQGQGFNWVAINNGITGDWMTSIYHLDGYIFAGTQYDQLYRTDNGGESWVEISDDLIDGRIYEITSINGNLFIAIDKSAIIKSSNYGDSWEEFNHGISNIYVRCIMVKDDRIFVCMANEGIQVSKDNGNTWEKIGQDIPDLNIRSLAYNSTSIFAGTSEHGIYRSFDNGISWESSNYGLPENNKIIPVIKATDSLILINYNKYYVYRSLNNGDSWEEANIQYSPRVMSFEIVNKAILAATRDEGIFQSYDGGETWTNVYNISPNYLKEIKKQDNSIFAATHFHVLTPQNDIEHNWTNYKPNWTNIDLNLPDIYVGTIEIINNYLVAGLYYEGFYCININYLSQWKYLSDIPDISSSKPSNLTSQNGNLYCGIEGFGVWRSSFPIIDDNNTKQHINSKVDFIHKPANESLILKLEQDFRSGNVKIIDLSGKTVYKSTIDSNWENKINTSHLKPGVYIICIESEGYYKAEKIYIQ